MSAVARKGDFESMESLPICQKPTFAKASADEGGDEGLFPYLNSNNVFHPKTIIYGVKTDLRNEDRIEDISENLLKGRK